MTITNTAVSVGTDATSLSAASGHREVLGFHVPTGGATVYIGGPGVTTTNGWPIVAGTAFMVTNDSGVVLAPDEEWYGIVAASTQDVRILQVAG